MSSIQNVNNTLARSLSELLALDGNPVALKFFANEDEMSQLTKFRVDRPYAICQLISDSRYMGRIHLAIGDDLGLCWGGLVAAGFADMPANVKNGSRYAGWQFLDERSSQKFFENLPRLPLNNYKGLLITPLGKCPLEPDLVIVFGNAAQMTALISAYAYDKGESMSFIMPPTVGCAYSVALPMLTKKPNMVVPCNGMRLLSMPDNSNLVFSAPFSEIGNVVKGLKFLRERGGPSYPPGWQHIMWRPEPPMSYITDPSGPGPIWLKKKPGE
ncbi:MAG: DUF169 domain-containing protein [Conexivisphaera sp.]